MRKTPFSKPFVYLIKNLILASFIIGNSFAVTLSETQALNFGSIPAQAGSSCTIDQSSNISGECITTDVNTTIGQITVSDLVADSQVEVIITGSNNGSLAFLATGVVAGGKTGTKTLSDGQPITVDVQSNGADLTIDVFGLLTIQTDVATSQSHAINYLVQVNEL